MTTRSFELAASEIVDRYNDLSAIAGQTAQVEQCHEAGIHDLKYSIYLIIDKHAGKVIDRILSACQANCNPGVNTGAHALASEILKMIDDHVPDPVETAKRLGPKITAHDIGRIAEELNMPKDALIDDMIEKIRELMLYAD